MANSSSSIYYQENKNRKSYRKKKNKNKLNIEKVIAERLKAFHGSFQQILTN